MVNTAPVEASLALQSAVVVFCGSESYFGCISAEGGSFIVEERKSYPGLIISPKKKNNLGKKG